MKNWAVIALRGIPNKAQVGDMGIDGRIFPVAATPKKRGAPTGELEFMDHWYPIQVKQKDRVGRPDIDSFEAVMVREDRTKGFFVAFDYSDDALTVPSPIGRGRVGGIRTFPAASCRTGQGPSIRRTSTAKVVSRETAYGTRIFLSAERDGHATVSRFASSGPPPPKEVGHPAGGTG